MMSRKTAAPTAPPTPPPDRFWLTRHRDEFLESLARQGYAGGTIKTFRRMVDRLCAEAEAHGFVPGTLDVDGMRELADGCPRSGTPYMERDLAMATRRFTGHLVAAGAIPAARPQPPPAGSTEHLCRELDHWLRHQRGMFGGRLRTHRNELRRVMAFCCTGTGTGTVEDLARITPEVLFALVDRDSGKGGWRLPYLRNILRFLFATGRLPRDLSAAIPRSASPRPDGSPRHLEPEVVRRLLEAIRSDRPRDLRDYAMLRLMARLGLRAQEVVALRLEDVDWGAGRMLVRGKGGQLDHLPIPVDVGEAMVAWLRDGRRGDSRRLFASVRPPYAPLTSWTVRRALRRAYQRAGLTPSRGEARTHALRHGLAMALLDGGSSLEEIGNVLRHRSAASTTAYAKYDHRALHGLVRPWPVAGGSR